MNMRHLKTILVELWGVRVDGELKCEGKGWPAYCFENLTYKLWEKISIIKQLTPSLVLGCDNDQIGALPNETNKFEKAQGSALFPLYFTHLYYLAYHCCMLR